MKRTVLIMIILLCMFSMAGAEPFVAPEGVPITSAGPRMVVTEPSYYFGVVGPDRELKHTFVFRNDGIEDLIIHKVSPP